MPEVKQVEDPGEYSLKASYQCPVAIVEDNRGPFDIVLIDYILETIQRPGICGFILGMEERMGNWHCDTHSRDRDEAEQREPVIIGLVGAVHNDDVGVVLEDLNDACGVVCVVQDGLKIGGTLKKA